MSDIAKTQSLVLATHGYYVPRTGADSGFGFVQVINALQLKIDDIELLAVVKESIEAFKVAIEAASFNAVMSSVEVMKVSFEEKSKLLAVIKEVN